MTPTLTATSATLGNYYNKTESDNLRKPYFSIRLITDLTTGTFPRTPTSITSYGQVSYIFTRGTAGNSGMYTFTFSAAHPYGSSFVANAIFYTSTSGTALPIGIFTIEIASSTVINLWIRNTSNNFNDGSFYLYTVP